MRYLTKVTETYRLESEKEVEKFLQELKSDHRFEVIKYTSIRRTKKAKGEIVDEWIRFEVTKGFNDEYEPLEVIEVDYRNGYDKASFKEGEPDSLDKDYEDEEEEDF